MPNQSTLEHPAEVEDEVFEASSAQAAIAAVHERLGPDARIVHAERCLRGGLGGFFARQVVRLTASPATAGQPASVTSPPTNPVGDVLGFPSTASPVDRLITGTEHAVGSAGPADSFADLLQGHRESTPTPAPAGLVAEHNDGPRWSRSVLIRLGLPSALVDVLDVGDGAGDLEWLIALADAVRPLCRPLPNGPCVYIGPLAGAFEHATRSDDARVARSTVFREALRTTHWSHGVAGGPKWREVLDDEPLAMSWGDVAALPDAVGCAYDLGLVLGSGPVGGVIRRARPLDVAIGIRSLIDDSPAPGSFGNDR